MKYEESRPRSGEYLRLALQHMGRHPAASNPRTFAVWYEYVCGTNRPLTHALLDMEQRGAPVDDGAIDQLHRRFVEPPDAATLESAGAALRALLKDLASSAIDTGGRASDFGRHLAGVLDASASQSPEQLAGSLREVIVKASALRDDVNRLEHRLEASQSEIAELHAALERARHEALLDPLSGLANRGAFDRALATATSAQPPQVVALFDIDHFKQVNDKHGHLVGDRVIQAVAAAVQALATHPRSTAARYGGEEFALVLPQLSAERGEAVAREVLERVRALRFRSRATGSVAFTVTVSAGVAELRAGETPAQWLARADAALYRAKAAGRDRIELG